MKPEDALSCLLSSLEAHEIGIRRDDIKWAFESPQTRHAVCAWVTENIHDNVLLTKDELELFHALEKRGLYPQLKKSAALLHVNPLSSREIEAIVKDLANENETIHAQSNILAWQLKSLESIKSEVSSVRKTTESFSTAKATKNAKERQQLSFQLDAEVDDCLTSYAAACKALNATRPSLRSTIVEELQSDDRLFGVLEQQHEEVQAFSSKNTKLEIYRDLGRRFQAMNEALIRTRLDREYLENIQELSKSDAVVLQRSEREVDVDYLADLNNLYTEISSVAEIAMNTTLNRVLQAASAASAALSAPSYALEDSSMILLQVQERMLNVTAHLQCCEAYSKALRTWCQISTPELHIIKQAVENTIDPAESPKLIRRLSSSKAYLSSSRTRRQVRRTSSSTDDDTDPVLPILRHFGCSRIARLPSFEADAAIEAEAVESRRKLHSQLQLLESSAGSLLVSHVADVDEMGQCLGACLYSTTQEPLEQTGSSSGVDTLQKKLDYVAHGMADTLSHHESSGDIAVAHFVKQWSGI